MFSSILFPGVCFPNICNVGNVFFDDFGKKCFTLKTFKQKNLSFFVCRYNFYFPLLMNGTESIILGGGIFKLRFWWIYMLWNPLNPKIQFLVIFACDRVCVCVCLSARVPVIITTQKQILAEAPSLTFYISISCGC